MIIGIECTAHTFGVGVVKDGKVLSNVKDMYRPKKGGIIPMESAKHHKDVSEIIYLEALQNISEKDVKAIAISNAPGLSPCLLEGLKFAKMKALELGVPLIPVNHCIAHLEIGNSVGAKDPILLYASGANTQIIAYVSGKYRVFGETLDSGIGNFIDTFGRHVGIPFPAGPELEKEAKNGQYVELPYSVKGMDISFSGMQTKMKQLYDSGKVKIKDLAYSMQETAFAMLVEVAERALAHTGKNELVLGGGVACNKRLQEMCKIMCEERGAEFFCPAKEFLVDNAAMIAFTGEIMFKSGIKVKEKDFDKLDIKPRERTDHVKVSWRT